MEIRQIRTIYYPRWTELLVTQLHSVTHRGEFLKIYIDAEWYNEWTKTTCDHTIFNIFLF